MPALVAFGRKWLIGSDDLVIPGFLDLIIRIAWLVATVIIYWEADLPSEKCPGEDYIKIHIYVSFSLLHLTIFADAALVQNSKVGNCMDVESRRHVPKCIYVRFILLIAEIVLGILATVWDKYNYFDCDNKLSNAVDLIQGSIISNWILSVIAIALILITFDPLGSNFLETQFIGHESELPPETINTRLWDLRCRIIGCACNHHPDEDAFKEVGKIIGTSLQGVNLVLTDMTAGLAILCLRNTYSKAALQHGTISEKLKTSHVITFEPEKLQINRVDSEFIFTNENWNSLKMINQFIKYSMAGYTWRFVSNEKNPLKKMWANSFCCGCLPWRKFKPSVDVESDNCCFCNTAAIKSITQADYDNLVLASFKNDYFEQQFYVAVDHTTKSIVVSFCGTISHKDYITDLTCWPVTLNIPGLPDNFKVHHGFAQSARVLKQKLEDKCVLKKEFMKYPGYSLVLTGHSLGAATATLLGIMLRPEYPNLKVFAYSPPGACLSIEAAEYCNEFVTSTTYGDDLACRLTLQSCEKIKEDITHALETCQTPKYRILLRSCSILNGRTPSSIDEESVEESNPKLRSVTDSKDFNSKAKMNGDKFRCTRLYPPGRILHITENPRYSSFLKSDNIQKSERWDYHWADRTEFDHLVVSTRMALDHLPYRMLKALKYLTDNSTTKAST